MPAFVLMSFLYRIMVVADVQQGGARRMYGSLKDKPQHWRRVRAAQEALAISDGVLTACRVAHQHKALFACQSSVGSRCGGTGKLSKADDHESVLCYSVSVGGRLLGGGSPQHPDQGCLCPIRNGRKTLVFAPVTCTQTGSIAFPIFYSHYHRESSSSSPTTLVQVFCQRQAVPAIGVCIL